MFEPYLSDYFVRAKRADVTANAERTKWRMAFAEDEAASKMQSAATPQFERKASPWRSWFRALVRDA